MRKWQQEAFQKHLQVIASGKTDFLVNATPGAGKTRFAVNLANYHLQQRNVDLVVVLCPTSNLKYQWAESATSGNLHLNPDFSNSTPVLPCDYHGFVATYAQMANKPELFRQITLHRKVLLITDEIHHVGVGEDAVWGNALLVGFERSKLRVHLTGTAFRGDSNKIPFVTYNAGGVCQPDYIYGYGEALRDGVVRPILFPSYGGEMTWQIDGEEITASFQDDVAEESSWSHRLRTALSPSSNWTHRILTDANQLLDGLRQTHQNAGGLILCQDQEDAHKTAQSLRKTTGENPIVVVSEDKEATIKIQEFAQSSRKWIVAVRMVSEGCDLPRLRVLVYKTNTLAKLFFWQAIGRVVRQTAYHPPGEAYCFIPADPRMIALAKTIEDEVKHSLNPRANQRDVTPHTHSRQLSLFQPVGAEADPFALIVGRKSVAVPMNMATLAQDAPAIISRQKQKEQLAAEINLRVQQLATTHRLNHAYVYSHLNSQQGVRSQNACTLPQLQQRLMLVTQWVANLNAA